ncbi:MAG: hypothetical protein ACO37W_17950 [Prochlorotrichaceae cyanobacterium]
MRGCGVKTAVETQQLLQDLQALEMGEVEHDVQHDRYLFRAYGGS